MSALYAMRYLGAVGVGIGAIYIGRGKMVGIDAAYGRYDGSYTEQNGRLRGTVSLSIPGGGNLVTGQPLPAGQSIQIAFDLPSTFANGQAQTVSVAGRPVQVTFEKIGDIP